ncbi:hypothetical protein D3C78_712480 [compost metagenome]
MGVQAHQLATPGPVLPGPGRHGLVNGPVQGTLAGAILQLQPPMVEFDALVLVDDGPGRLVQAHHLPIAIEQQATQDQVVEAALVDRLFRLLALDPGIEAEGTGEVGQQVPDQFQLFGRERLFRRPPATDHVDPAAHAAGLGKAGPEAAGEIKGDHEGRALRLYVRGAEDDDIARHHRLGVDQLDMGEPLAVDLFRKQPVGIVVLFDGHHLDIGRQVVGMMQGDRDITSGQHLAESLGQTEPGRGLVQALIDQPDQLGQRREGLRDFRATPGKPQDCNGLSCHTPFAPARPRPAVARPRRPAPRERSARPCRTRGPCASRRQWRACRLPPRTSAR